MVALLVGTVVIHLHVMESLKGKIREKDERPANDF